MPPQLDDESDGIDVHWFLRNFFFPSECTCQRQPTRPTPANAGQRQPTPANASQRNLPPVAAVYC